MVANMSDWRGVALEGAWLYCTTFPCHNCAKHLVAAGFRRVFFIEPYPKSLAEELHPDSVVIDPSANEEDRLQFLPFVGVAPNIYLPLYERSGKRKQPGGKALNFDRPTARPKSVEGWDWTYLEREGLLVNELAERLEAANESLVDGWQLPEVGERPDEGEVD